MKQLKAEAIGEDFNINDELEEYKLSKKISSHPNILNIDKCYVRLDLDAETYTIYYEMPLAESSVEKLIEEEFFKGKIPELKILAQ